MKKLVSAALCALAMVGLGNAFGEQLDYWDLRSSTLTDGVWTFNIQRKGGLSSYLVNRDPAVYFIAFSSVAAYPETPSTLDFSKPVVNNSGDSYTHVISQINGSLFTAAIGPSLQELVLPTHGYDIKFVNSFANCTNLTTITPFLPANVASIPQNCFKNLSKLTGDLVYSGAGFGAVQGCFYGTGITSVDFSQSTMSNGVICRDWFSECKSLVSVKLPATIEHQLPFNSLTTTVRDPFVNCTALTRVDFYGFPTNGLNYFFTGCTALSELHFYNCAPVIAPNATILDNIGASQTVTTYLHNMTDDQLSAWGTYCAEGGAITESSTWAKTLAGSTKYTARPLVEFAEQHVSFEVGDDADVLNGVDGTFIVRRLQSDPLATALPVYFTLSGTAGNGVDYAELSGVVTIPAGETEGTIVIHGLYTGYEGTKTVVATLTESSGYTLSGTTSGEITLTSGSLSASIAKKTDADKGAGTAGVFVISRGADDPTGVAMDVNVAYSGTAANGTTYKTLSSVITIPAGERSVEVKVIPLDDANVSADTTAVITLQPGQYELDGATVAEVAIAYSETWGCWRLTDNTTMTDGTWTFTVARKGLDTFIIPDSGGKHQLWLSTITRYPDSPSVLDLSKECIDLTSDTLKYEVVSVSGDMFTETIGPSLRELVLPTHGYFTGFSGKFQYCTELTTITPFLPPTITSIAQSTFANVPKLTCPLVYKGAGFGTSWQMFQNTPIPSVDFSESTMTFIGRSWFEGNTALTTMKFPATIAAQPAFDLTYRDCFSGCTSLARVEFYGFPANGLSYWFGNCSALAEVHFYSCAPSATPAATVYSTAASGKTLTTYLHDMTDAQLAAWGTYCAAGGEITADSVWSTACVGSNNSLRPLIEYQEQHVTFEVGDDADVLTATPGTFIVRREATDNLSVPLAVAYTVSGTAVGGTDYEALTGVVTIPADKTSAVIEVTPLYTGTEETRTVAVALAAGSYTLSGTTSGEIEINSGRISVSIAKGGDADKETATSGYFIISRGENDSTAVAVKVYISASGTATEGTTYSALPTYVTIPAGEESVKVFIKPLDDANVSADTTVTLTITGDAYDITGSAAASANIAYAETWGGWHLYNDYMTDGTWYFKCTRSGSKIAGTSIYGLTVTTCTNAPAEVGTLDFSKGIQNETGDGKAYAITTLTPAFCNAYNVYTVGVDKFSTLVLPDEGYLTTLGDSAFHNCTNLTTVTPFLPSSVTSLSRYVFAGCTKLASPLVYGGSAFGASGVWDLMSNTAIPSADFSKSTITALYRAAFSNCTKLKELRLPATIEKVGPMDLSDSLANRSAIDGCSDLKVYVTGDAWPQFHTNDAVVVAVEFDEKLTELREGAFAGLTALRNVYFRGTRPEAITQQTGPTLFPGFTERQVTCWVPNKYADDWKTVAVGGEIAVEGSDWISGTTQTLKLWNYGHTGFYILIGGGVENSEYYDEDNPGALGFVCTLECDRENGQYAIGENATFTLVCTQDGQADLGREVRLTWYNGNEVVSSENLTIAKAKTTISKPVTQACSYRLVATPLDANGKSVLTYSPQAGVICDKDNISLPAGYMPDDFDAWWNGELAVQANVSMAGAVRTVREPDASWSQAKKASWNAVNNYDVRIPAAGTNWVAGGMSIPKDTTKTYPAVIKFYGVGWDGVCECDYSGADSRQCIAFNVNCHGLPSATATWEEDYPAMRAWIENYAASGPEAWQGYYPMIGTSQGRDNVYFRYVYLRAARAIEYVKSLPEWDGKTIVVCGCSQGAAQSVAAAALCSGVTHVVLGVPALTDFSGSLSTPARAYGWPFNTRPPTYDEAEYFDVVNLAHRIQNAKVFVVCGLVDYLVQPCGPVSLYNAFDNTNDKTFVSHSGWSHDSVACWTPMNAVINEACKQE